MQKKDPNSEKGRQINTIKEAITALTSEADHKIATLTAEADKSPTRKKKDCATKGSNRDLTRRDDATRRH